MRLLLGFLVFAAWASIARYYYVCTIKHHCETEEVNQDPLRPKTLHLLLDDTLTVLQDYEQFAFVPNSIAPTLSENNGIFLDSIAQILGKDTLKNLTITGFYRATESGFTSGIFENLGIARAAGIRSLLVNRGLKENRISLDAQIAEGEQLLEPLTFDLFSVNDAIPEEYNKIQFSFTNMTYSDANFEKDSDVFSPGEAFRFYADSVKTYLDLETDQRLRIVGHCDNTGTDQYNYNLGLRRANNAKAYFEGLGVEKEIVVESKGEKEPVSPNDTPENQQKNRRVQIIIE